MSTLHFLADGFGIAFQWHNLLFAFVGVIIGTAVGVLPGIGPMSGVALLIPVTATITSGMPTDAAAASSIILLAGVYYGAMYGGSTTSILLNTPGESSSVVTTLDGYQMARQGRAGAALAISAIGSFCCRNHFTNRSCAVSGTAFQYRHQIWTCGIFLFNAIRFSRSKRASWKVDDESFNDDCLWAYARNNRH